MCARCVSGRLRRHRRRGGRWTSCGPTCRCCRATAGRCSPQGVLTIERSADLTPGIRADIWRRRGRREYPAFTVGTASECRLQRSCKNGNGSDWNTNRACAGSVDRVRQKLVRSENHPGQADDRKHNPAGRSACAVWYGCNPCSKSSAPEHSTIGQPHLARRDTDRQACSFRVRAPRRRHSKMDWSAFLRTTTCNVHCNLVPFRPSRKVRRSDCAYLRRPAAQFRLRF